MFRINVISWTGVFTGAALDGCCRMCKVAGSPHGSTSTMPISLEILNVDSGSELLARNFTRYTPAVEKPIEFQETWPSTNDLPSMLLTVAFTGLRISSVQIKKGGHGKKQGSMRVGLAKTRPRRQEQQNKS